MGLAFLDTVARAYVENFDDLSEFCFVFPNKRAGTFFRRSLMRYASGRFVLAPHITSITDFTTFLSGHIVDSRIDMLFRLYNIYRDGKKGGEVETLADFEAFRTWGEILISDFSETDQYDVNAAELFKNVKDIHEIQSNFLTDNQKKVLEQYFGYTPSGDDVKRFWKVFDDNSADESKIKSRFIELWRQMHSLYQRFNDSLDAEGLCTPGGAYRLALRRLEDAGREALPWKKVVIVGFNALSTTEAMIFRELQNMDACDGIPGDFAEFYWDGTGPVLTSDDNDAAAFLKLNRQNFPSPDWAEKYLEQNRVTEMPTDIEIIAAPSNSAQTKIASDIIETLSREINQDDIMNARVAVVLPDENLLMPLLYALPDGIKVNLTMGYPLRLTSVVSFIHHLRALHARSRIDGDTAFYYHEDLRLLLSHPYMHALLGSDAVSKINAYITGRHKIVISNKELSEFSDECVHLLRAAAPGADTANAIAYVDEILARIDAGLTTAQGIIKPRIDRSHIALYRDALRRLGISAKKHDIALSLTGVLTMADRLIAGEQVAFEGEPLEGLQVMGILETRALDFDRLLVLSMNDRIMPRKASKRSFIPDTLRHAYGMPFANYHENLFSYYFYRMISRATGVTLLYDARAGSGMRSGGPSRYLMQLRHLYAADRLRYRDFRFALASGKADSSDIDKTPQVINDLQKFTIDGSGRNLSASALKKYFQCPARFYYESVVKLNAEKEPAIYMDSATQGTVVHDSMLNLYLPDPKMQKIYLKHPVVIDSAYIDSLLANPQVISRAVIRAVNQHYFKCNKDDEKMMNAPLTGAAAMIAEHLESMVRDILNYDRRETPFDILGCEISDIARMDIGDGITVNIKYAIDRLDRVMRNGRPCLRIVDYKTGSAGVYASKREQIFDGTDDAKNIFQLMLYADMLCRKQGIDTPIALEIYESSSIEQGPCVPTVEKIRIVDYQEHRDWFVEETRAKLREIFDPATPFTAQPSDHACQYCTLAFLCGRQ